MTLSEQGFNDQFAQLVRKQMEVIEAELMNLAYNAKDMQMDLVVQSEANPDDWTFGASPFRLRHSTIPRDCPTPEGMRRLFTVDLPPRSVPQVEVPTACTEQERREG